MSYACQAEPLLLSGKTDFNNKKKSNQTNDEHLPIRQTDKTAWKTSERMDKIVDILWKYTFAEKRLFKSDLIINVVLYVHSFLLKYRGVIIALCLLLRQMTTLVSDIIFTDRTNQDQDLQF